MLLYNLIKCLQSTGIQMSNVLHYISVIDNEFEALVDKGAAVSLLFLIWSIVVMYIMKAERILDE